MGGWYIKTSFGGGGTPRPHSGGWYAKTPSGGVGGVIPPIRGGWGQL
jgi:hypothetical protein